jgi:hypothetical protein
MLQRKVDIAPMRSIYIEVDPDAMIARRKDGSDTAKA